MKIYHTETKEDFEDFKSKHGLPHTLKWEDYKENAVILLGDYGFSVMPISKARRRYPGYEIVKYERDVCGEMFMGRLIENHDNVNRRISMEKIYLVETQEDYKALMVELEDKGISWMDGTMPTLYNVWPVKEEETTICVCDSKKITYLSSIDAKTYYPDTTIQKYKVRKGDKSGEGVRNLNQAIGEALSSNHDAVNSPKHYTRGELEVIDILQDKLTAQEFEGFLKGNILKYTFREGIKNGTEDMKKGAWYMSRLIDFRDKQEG